MAMAHGIKSECTEDGTIVWHVMEGTRPDGGWFATWTNRIASFFDYTEAKATLRQVEGCSRKISVTILEEEKPSPPAEHLEIVCNEDGSVTAHMDSWTAARLGGRDNFGSVPAQQERWQNTLREAWYADECARD